MAGRRGAWILVGVLLLMFFFVLAPRWENHTGTAPGLPEPAGMREPASVTEPIPLAQVLREKGIEVSLTAPRLVVKKSAYTLTLYDGDTKLKTYAIALGFSPRGDKEVEGDGRTPEGEFYICQKAENPEQRYLGTRWLRLSYPMPEDAERGLAQGIITQREYEAIRAAAAAKRIPPQRTGLGGGVGIHGGNFLRGGHVVRNWTAGCIGLFDADIEELYPYVPVGTPVSIHP